MVKQGDGSPPFLKLGKEQTDAMLGVHKELLEAYEQASRAWLARVKSEVDLWSELANKLAATRSAPEAMQACQQNRGTANADGGRGQSPHGGGLSKDHEQARPLAAERMAERQPMTDGTACRRGEPGG